MSYYIKTLFYAIPTFAFLILIEAIVANIKGLKINRPADVISSLSSGITNTIRDAIKFTFAIAITITSTLTLTLTSTLTLHCIALHHINLH